MVVTTSAIILSSRKQGETSKIVTLYTAAYGKLNVIAKGAREMRSKFGSALEAFALSDVVFYYKKDKGGLCLISKAETIRSHAGILVSLERIEAASQIVELTSRAMHDEEENPKLFALLAETMNAIASQSEESLKAVILFFFLRFIEISGFRINLDVSVSEASISGHQSSGLGTAQSLDAPVLQKESVRQNSASRTRTHACFKIKTGEIVSLNLSDTESNARYDNDVIPIYADSIAALRYLEFASIEKAASLRLSRRAFQNLTEIFSAFFSEHFEGLHHRPLRSIGSLTR